MTTVNTTPTGWYADKDNGNETTKTRDRMEKDNNGTVNGTVTSQ